MPLARHAILALLALLALAACSKRASDAVLPPLAWESVRTPQDLDRALEKARRERRAVVVDMTASWCGPCQALHEYVHTRPDVHRRLERMARLKVDVSGGDLPAVREALGLQRGTPQMVFFAADGTRLPQQVHGWDGRRSARILDSALP